MIDTLPEKKWRVRNQSPSEAARLARELGLPPLAGQLLCNRGLVDAASARDFLRPRLADLPGPDGFQGMGKAASLVAEAVQAGQVIGVAGDYDADGVTATALLVDFLRQCGGKVVWDLPHRLSEGYGFLPPRAQRLAQAGARLVITVDCGVSDIEGVGAAKELGLTVIVTDHHQLPPGVAAPADAMVNPQQDACALAKHLAGVGVAFYLAAACRAELRARGWFATRPAPNLRQSLDLVAVGTCADVVPLVGHNRILVREGLLVLNQGGRRGLRALADASGARGPLDAKDLAFALAPRINAAGRIDHPAQALELLLCQDEPQAAQRARLLDQLNQQRRAIEQEMLGQALEDVASEPRHQRARLLVLGRAGWHRGVLGIVASRVVEATGKPALLFAIENGTAVGSGRSVEGFHLQRALVGVKHLLQHFGGHAQAAGMTTATANLPELWRQLDQAAQAALPPGEGAASLELETAAHVSQLGPGLVDFLADLAPHGQANPEPLLLVEGATVLSASSVGRGHLRLLLGGAAAPLPAFWLGHGELAADIGGPLSLACQPRVSTYGGRHLELFIHDLRPGV